MSIDFEDHTRFLNQDAIEGLNYAPPTSQTVKEFKRVVGGTAKAARKQGVKEIQWVNERVGQLAVCEKMGTIFELERKQAKEAIEYGKLDEVLLTRVPYCIIDNHGAVLVNPPMLIAPDMVGLDVFIYLNAGTWEPGQTVTDMPDEHFMAEALMGITNVKDGPQGSRHFVGPVKFKSLVYRDGGVYALPEFVRPAITRDIIQSLAIALDQSFYIRENIIHPVFNTPIHKIAVTTRDLSGN